MATKYAELNPKTLGCVLGIFIAIDSFLHILLPLKGINFMWYTTEVYNLFMANLPGVSLSFVGAVVALIWGFVCGFICGFIFGWLYNKCLTCSFCKA